MTINEQLIRYPAFLSYYLKVCDYLNNNLAVLYTFIQITKPCIEWRFGNDQVLVGMFRFEEAWISFEDSTEKQQMLKLALTVIQCSANKVFDSLHLKVDEDTARRIDTFATDTLTSEELIALPYKKALLEYADYCQRMILKGLNL